jgi:hypothetical protein
VGRVQGIIMDKTPFNIMYTDGDKFLTLTLEKEILTLEEAGALSDHLSYFVQEMAPEVEGADAIGEMMMAQYDDDPNPYHGDYSEE